MDFFSSSLRESPELKILLLRTTKTFHAAREQRNVKVDVMKRWDRVYRPKAACFAIAPDRYS